MFKMFEVKGSVALITGGASGIGLAIAKELLRKEAKAVSLVDLHKDGEKVLNELLDEFGTDRAIFIKTDVTDSHQLEDAFENTTYIFHQLDLVFNNAGIVDEVNWEKSINVNLVGCIKGTMLATEKYLPKYGKRAYSIVVNTSSIAGFRTYPTLAVYGATKSGIISFTKAMGMLYEKSKIRVIAICPGGTNTQILSNILEKIPEHYRKMTEGMLEDHYRQEPEILASHVVNILESASSASVWVLENNEVRKLESDF